MSQPDRLPQWLELLINARQDFGGMTYREIARRSGISHTQVTNVFTGKSKPSAPVLAKIAHATGADTPMLEAIMVDYDPGIGPEKALADYRPQRRGPIAHDDVVLLADAINSLAGAINNLAFSKRPTILPEWLIELRRIRRAHGRPTARDIATSSGLTERMVARFFAGEVIPTEESLTAIVTAMDPEAKDLEVILDMFYRRSTED